MPITQSLNSKANIKKPSNQDLPFSTQQPIIASYYGVSTLGQTVINLSFSVDTTVSDIFWLFVDGKKLTLGSSNDYTFTSVGSDLTTTQVTLNSPITNNLNIQAYKLGLKSETEFNMDNRFVQLYAYESAGFQGFVSQTNTVNVATTATGSPVAGTFYSSITNRAPMIDLSQDMKARMGVERIITQSVYQLQNEFGPNGEPVFANANDVFGQIRFVGPGWVNQTDLSGVRPISGSTASLDYIEVTFYGTGLNLLTNAFTGNSATAAVDGGAAGANFFAAAYSSVIQSRNYTPNQTISVASGLTLGIHTVKILSTATTQMSVCGFEVINTNSTNVTVNPGIGYIQNKTYTSAAASTFAFNSVATGTRGGRVLVYQNGDGSVGKAWQAVNASSALLGSADHTNEEIARTYYPREFGAGRLDDFSRSGGAQASAFTLDDGTTSLVATSAGFATVNNIEGTSFGGASNSFTFTFVGTGLDIQASASSLVGYTFTYAVDGSAAAAITFTNNQTQNKPIVSGLPYGSHTFRLTLTAATSGTFVINKFIVYQPKIPALPSGTIQLADYNVMANFSTAALTDNTLNGALILAQGTLYKSIAREWLFTGANWALAVSPYPSGFDASTGTNNGQTATYTFFGTGAVLTVENSSGGTFSVSVTVDGSLFSTATALQNISNAGGGTYTTTTTTTQIPGRISVSGLTLGVHTIIIQRTAGTGSFFFDDIQIITPIHSYKSNLYADLQNTLLVGSNAISDGRKLTPVKDALPATKAWAQANGITSGPTTTSTTFIPCPDMSCTIKTSGGPIQIAYNIMGANSTAGDNIAMQIYVDGGAVGTSKFVGQLSGALNGEMSDVVILPVSPGTHKIDVYWACLGGGTNTLETTRRNMTVREL